MVSVLNKNFFVRKVRGQGVRVVDLKVPISHCETLDFISQYTLGPHSPPRSLWPCETMMRVGESLQICTDKCIEGSTRVFTQHITHNYLGKHQVQIHNQGRVTELSIINTHKLSSTLWNSHQFSSSFHPAFVRTILISSLHSHCAFRSFDLAIYNGNS
jgi:hypothetical protein